MHIKFSLSLSLSLSLRERRLDAAVVRIAVLMFCLHLPVSARAVAVPASDDETKADTFELMSVRTGAELERGPHHQVLETIAEYRDKTGRTMMQTNSITVLATGLSYLDQGQWRPTREEIEVLDAVAVARHGPHKVIWPLEMNCGESVEVMTAGGQRFVVQVLGLSYYDAATGASVLIAELKPSRAELAAPNKLFYSDAFDGVKADLVYEYRRGSVAQEVVLREQLPDPREYGFEPETTRFEVVTEFLEVPKPVVERIVVRAETNPVRRVLMAEPDLTDDRLGFGEYAIGPGRAFSIGDGVGGQKEPLVSKRWEEIEGRKVLFEQVEWNGLELLLAELPKHANAGGLRDRTKRVASFERLLPQRPKVARSTASYSSETKGGLVASVKSPVVKQSKGVVIDWELVQSQANLTFKGDTTYLVMGPVNLTGITTIEGGSVVKYTNAIATPKISVTGTIKCKTGPYRPAFFTAKDDNTVGEIIPGSTGSPIGYYGNPAIEARTSSQVLEELRVRYAHTGVLFHDYSAGSGNGLLHAQLVRCGRAVQFNGYGTTFQNFALRNVLIHLCTTGVYGYSFSGQIEHLTAHQCTQLAYDYNGQVYGTTSSLLVTNSVLAEVEALYAGRPVTVAGGYNGFWPGPGFGSPKWTAASDPFCAVGAGAHYLSPLSQFFNCGTALISPELMGALARKTVYAPIVRTNPFASDMLLGPTARRDCDDQPDLGWHYAPLDYMVSGKAITNCVLVLTNGVAVGFYGPFGFALQNGGQLVSGGSPLTLNRLARYELVQEQPVVLGDSGPSISVFSVSGMPTALPQVRLRFTDISFPAGSWSKRLFLDNCYTYALDKLELRDCQVHGAALNISFSPIVGDNRVMTVGLTNNIFSRVWFSLDQDTDVPRLVVQMRNNLFLGGWVKVADYMGTGTWSARDNLFDQASLMYWSGVPNSHNGYTASSPLPGSGGGDVLNLAPDYVTGTLGAYYYPDTGNQLAKLINAGSRSAAEAGLYHYTVKTSNVKEGTDTPATVDIGFHYVACANSVPIDTDSDGLADYYEDSDGDGNGLEELTDWNNAHTLSNSYTDLQSLEFAANYLVNDPGQDYANEQNTQFQPGVVVLGDTVIVGYWDSNRGVYGLGDPGHCDAWANLGICRMAAYSVSIDGGRTFADMDALPLAGGAACGDAGDPVLAVDRSSGVVYYVATPDFSKACFKGVPFWKSTDKGASFTRQPTVMEEIDKSDYPWIAVDDWPGTGEHDVYVVVAEREDPFPFVWFLSVSQDGGTTWSTPTSVTEANSAMPQMVVGSDHTAYLAWAAWSSPVEVHVRSITNRGRTIGGIHTSATTSLNYHRFDLNRTNWSADTFWAYVYPALAVNPDANRGNHLYMAYADKGTSPGDCADIFFVHSTDGGEHWDTAPFRVNTDSTINDQWMPAIAVHPNGNQLFIGWLDRRNDLGNSMIDVYGRWGRIDSSGDVLFSSDFRITTESFPPAFSGTLAANRDPGHYDPVYAPEDVNLNWWYGESRWPFYVPCLEQWPNLTDLTFRAMTGEHHGAYADSSCVYMVWSDNRKGSQATAYPNRRQADIRLARLPWPPL